jgi:hypothetical protein
MSPDEWLMMRDIEKLLGRTFRRDVVPGFEPAVTPLQPEEKRAAAAPKQTGPSLRGRQGRARRR